jgi:hypothetical protein
MSPRCIDDRPPELVPYEPGFASLEIGGQAESPVESVSDNQPRIGKPANESPADSVEINGVPNLKLFSADWLKDEERKARWRIACDRQRGEIAHLRAVLAGIERAINGLLEREPDCSDVANGWDRQLARLLVREVRLKKDLATATQHLRELEASGPDREKKGKSRQAD